MYASRPILTPGARINVLFLLLYVNSNHSYICGTKFLVFPSQVSDAIKDKLENLFRGRCRTHIYTCWRFFRCHFLFIVDVRYGNLKGCKRYISTQVTFLFFPLSPYRTVTKWTKEKPLVKYITGEKKGIGGSFVVQIIKNKKRL